MSVDRLDPADHQDLDRHQRREKLDPGEVGGVQVDRGNVRRPVLIIELAEPGYVPPLLPERSHHADPRQRLLEVAGDGGDLLAGQPVGVGRGDPERHSADQEDRDGEECEQRQMQVQHEQGLLTIEPSP